jgi:hypothetical protein
MARFRRRRAFLNRSILEMMFVLLFRAQHVDYHATWLVSNQNRPRVDGLVLTPVFLVANVKLFRIYQNHLEMSSKPFLLQRINRRYDNFFTLTSCWKYWVVLLNHYATDI